MFSYKFQFGIVFARMDVLFDGALRTIWMSALAILLGFLIALACGMASRYGNRILKSAVRVYVEVFRNTPFLVQLFFIYLGLPDLGIRLTPIQAGLIALSINAGAYLTEIVRAGLDSIHRSQIEAGASIGLSDRQIFFYVILTPAFTNIYPALQSQFTLIMLGSSIISAISIPELTGASGMLESQSARPFEVYIVTGCIYFVIAVMFKLLLDLFVFRVLRLRAGNARRAS